VILLQLVAAMCTVQHRS